MNLTAEPTPEPSKSKRRKRGCLLAVIIVLVLLLPGLYLLENWSGRRALEKVIADYEASGDSLDPATFLPKAVPAEENFGATPLLDGIMDEPVPYAAGKVLRDRRKALTELFSYDWLRVLSPPPGARTKSSGPIRSYIELLDLDFDWKDLRESLHKSHVFAPSLDEPSDVKAVYDSLETRRALFDEFCAAAERRYSIFTPATGERAAQWPESARLKTDWPYPTSYHAPEWAWSLCRLFVVRARAAAALGKSDESAALAKVVWRLGEAISADGAAFGSLVANRYWSICACDLMRLPSVNEATLSRLLGIPGAAWSPEAEFRRAIRLEAACELAIWRGVIADPEHSLSDFEPRFPSKLHQKLARYGPRGWLEQNAVTYLRQSHQFVLRPLEKGGFADLLGAAQWFEAATAGDNSVYSPYRMLTQSFVGNYVIRQLVFRTTRPRLTLLALGMGRYRLKHGRYPADTAALVPDCMAAVPPDIDGAPLRIATSPDGARSVLYSLGWNLKDDWHGTLPAGYKEDDHGKNEDWPLALPFPPLPPP